VVGVFEDFFCGELADFVNEEHGGEDDADSYRDG